MVAVIVGAGVAVVANFHLAGLALAANTQVALGAVVAVRTRVAIAHMHAALDGVAQVRRAQVIVIAQLCRAGRTSAVLARVALRAQIVVAANCRVVAVDAALFRVATVRCAYVVVVAAFHAAGHAKAAAAQIVVCAIVVVAARKAVGAEHATQLSVTAIVAARVAVVAHRGFASRALAALATVAKRANVVVTAAQLIRRENAARLAVATICGARVVVIAGRDRSRQTNAAFASIVACANVVVAAFAYVIGRRSAPQLCVATVHRAWIFVVTSQHLAHALDAHAFVVFRARIGIVALHRIGRMLALASDAIVIATNSSVVAHAWCRFIGLAVAVVVFLVALFQIGTHGVARAQAICTASALAGARSGCIGVAARGDQLQFGGAAVAAAHQVIFDTLIALHAAQAGDLFATVARAAVAVADALAAAKIANR